MHNHSLQEPWDTVETKPDSFLLHAFNSPETVAERIHRVILFQINLTENWILVEINVPSYSKMWLEWVYPVVEGVKEHHVWTSQNKKVENLVTEILVENFWNIREKVDT